MELLVLDFINSRKWADNPPDDRDLQDNDWAHWFLHKWGIQYTLPFSDQETETLNHLHDLFWEFIVQRRVGEKFSEERLAELNRYLSQISLHYQLSITDHSYRVVLASPTDEWYHLLYRITTSFVELLTQHEIGRVRECENPACCWVFYDVSKNQTRRWCGQTCASLIKVRRFREKKKAASSK
jgi:predicted RNA-binding Zn ribbon-like protein